MQNSCLENSTHKKIILLIKEDLVNGENTQIHIHTYTIRQAENGIFIPSPLCCFSIFYIFNFQISAIVWKCYAKLVECD